MKKKLGFTLAELCISIITISIITGAIAPVITKKLSTKAKANANQLTSDCAQFNTKITHDSGTTEEFKGYCKLCYEHKCVSCKLDFRPGYVVIQDTCEYKKCKELHGNNCTEMCTELECLDNDSTGNTRSNVDPNSWEYHYQSQVGDEEKAWGS